MAHFFPALQEPEISIVCKVLHILKPRAIEQASIKHDGPSVTITTGQRYEDPNRFAQSLVPTVLDLSQLR